MAVLGKIDICGVHHQKIVHLPNIDLEQTVTNILISLPE